MRPFSLIVAMDSKRGIGKAGLLPWHLTGDMQHFKTLTEKTDNPQKRNLVIMGRKTWDSIPEKFRPLPNRINLVLTRNQNLRFPPDVFFTDSLEKAFSLFEKAPQKEKIAEIFVIGGAQVFEVALNLPACKTLYLTEIKQTFECDTFFPAFKERFKQKSVSEIVYEKGIPYFFSEYQQAASSGDSF